MGAEVETNDKHAETLRRAEMVAQAWVSRAPIPSRETCAELDVIVASLRVAVDQERDKAQHKLLAAALNLLGTTALVLERARLEFDVMVRNGLREVEAARGTTESPWVR